MTFRENLALSAVLALGTLASMGTSPAQALTLTEDFEAPFPAWESGWLGTNTNLQNFYGQGANRGNNPDGLWLDDGDGQRSNDVVDIVFNSSFGATLTSLSIDIAGYTPIRFSVYDISNVQILDTLVTLTGGAFNNPGVYSNYSVTSNNGISRFSFLPINGTQVEGNTSIDNVMVNIGSTPVPTSVPTPALLPGLIGMGAAALRKKGKKEELVGQEA